MANNHEPNNNQMPRRSGFITFLPFLLLIAAVIGLVFIIINNTRSSSNVWYESDLDTTLRLADDKHGGQYYIVRAVASTTDRTTTINGVYLDKPQNKEYAFTTTIDNERFENPFIVSSAPTEISFPYYQVKDKDSSITWHYSYKEVFSYKINVEYKNSGSTLPDPITYFKTNNAYQVSWWDVWGPTIIGLLITVFIIVFLFSRLSKSIGGANSQALSFNQSRAKREDSSKVKFADVAGCDEEKAEMVEVVQYLKEPAKFSRLGAKLPKGILLVGPPGTGKTLLAKAVAGEAGVPFYSISGSDFVEMFVGVGAGRVRDMFRKAKQTAPCLVFIDEIDAVGRQRGAGLGGGNDEREQTLNQLLVEMDGFSDNSGIIVVAATNRSDVLDPALLRAGRFDRQITVSLPDKAGREAIFLVHARNKKVDPSVNFEALARRTVGFSGADIENIMNEAAILAVREKRDLILIKDIDEAIDRRIAGPAKKSRHMTEIERKTVAYHEAGHAIIGLTIPESDKVQKITIIPRGQTGGHVLMSPENDRFLLTKKELIARIVGYLGGRSSEEVFFNDISTGAQNDIEVATRIARLMVTEYGMSKLGPIQYEKDTGSVFLGRDYMNSQKNFSAQVAVEIDQAVREIIDEAHKEAIRIIKQRKDDVILIANTLLEHESITSEQIDSLLKNRTLDKSVEVKDKPDENSSSAIKVDLKSVTKKEEPKETPTVKKTPIKKKPTTKK